MEGDKDENKEVERRGRMSSSRLLFSTRLPSPAKQVIIIIMGSRHGQLLGAIFLNYFRKTDIAKNVVLRGELVSFPYGAKAVHRSSAVFLNSLRKIRSNRGHSNKSF